MSKTYKEEYQKIADNLRVGDVLLVNGKGIRWGALPIKLANFFKRGFRNRHWTHAAIFVGDGRVVEAFPQEIANNDLEEKYFNGDHDILLLRLRQAPADRLAAAAAFCASEKGKKYDFRALVYFPLYNLLPVPLHFLIDNKYVDNWFNVSDAYFCSELIAEGLRKAGIYCFEELPYKVMPVFYNNELLFEKIAEYHYPRNGILAIEWLKAAVFYLFY